MAVIYPSQKLYTLLRSYIPYEKAHKSSPQRIPPFSLQEHGRCADFIRYPGKPSANCPCRLPPEKGGHTRAGHSRRA